MCWSTEGPSGGTGAHRRCLPVTGDLQQPLKKLQAQCYQGNTEITCTVHHVICLLAVVIQAQVTSTPVLKLKNAFRCWGYNVCKPKVHGKKIRSKEALEEMEEIYSMTLELNKPQAHENKETHKKTHSSVKTNCRGQRRSQEQQG